MENLKEFDAIQYKKAIFCKEENKDILERLIEEVIDKKVEIISLDVPEVIKKNESGFRK